MLQYRSWQTPPFYGDYTGKIEKRTVETEHRLRHAGIASCI
nr:MAG TPA: hypothetical protein [Caudoviricetes sp.]